MKAWNDTSDPPGAALALLGCQSCLENVGSSENLKCQRSYSFFCPGMGSRTCRGVLDYLEIFK